MKIRCIYCPGNDVTIYHTCQPTDGTYLELDCKCNDCERHFIVQTDNQENRDVNQT